MNAFRVLKIPRRRQLYFNTIASSCPVCRYVQTPELVDGSQCAVCPLRENLWICLICGHIGCGRYGQKHAYRHFEQTGHMFALELGKNLVWDYAADAYVHRLALNHEDGKIVQVGESSETGDKKLDSLNLEFSAVLVSQLDSQRAYFEDQLDHVTSQSTARVEVAEGRIKELTKEKQASSRKLQSALTTVQRLQKEIEEERALNARLTSNEQQWRARAEKAESEVKQAQETCQELMLNLELRSKLDQLTTSDQLTNQEVESSELSIQSPSTSASGGGRRKSKRHSNR